MNFSCNSSPDYNPQNNISAHLQLKPIRGEGNTGVVCVVCFGGRHVRPLFLVYLSSRQLDSRDYQFSQHRQTGLRFSFDDFLAIFREPQLSRCNPIQATPTQALAVAQTNQHINDQWPRHPQQPHQLPPEERSSPSSSVSRHSSSRSSLSDTSPCPPWARQTLYWSCCWELLCLWVERDLGWD